MRFWLYTALAVAAMAATGLAQTPSPAAAQPKPPIEAFANLPTVDDPAISPDGKRLALIQAYKGRPVATVWTLEPAGQPPIIIPYEEAFIDNVQWANNQRLLIRINSNARVWYDKVNPWYRTVSINPEAKNPVLLFSNKEEARNINYSASSIIDMAPNDPDHIYMPLYTGGTITLGQYDTPRSTVFRVDVNTGRADYVERGTIDTVRWVMDGDGNLVARVDQTKSPLTDHLYVYTADKKWREIATTDAQAGHGFDIEGLTLDGKSLVLDASTDTTGTSGLMALALADGKEQSFYFHPLYDVGGTISDPWTGRIAGVTYTSHMPKAVLFAEKLQQMQKTVEDMLPGLSILPQSWDRTMDKIVFSATGPTAPTAYYVYNSQTKQIQRLGRTYPQLQSSDLGLVQVYDYKARDGLAIPAYLTLPPGKEAKNLPVVILPHGGPMARDTMDFDWESQFLANRGYAVLRPNFRGSSGYGRKFEEAGYGEWGLKMQDDITDGVKKLIADGIADPKRICIVGGSYGGYAALAGAAFTPDIYACAAAWAPVTDLREFLSTRSADYGSDSWMISTWTRYIGDRRSDSKKLDAASPSENAAKITIPVLLMHGEADATVRINQSEIMERALRRAGKKATFIRIEKETHYMQAASTRIRWLTELEKFLKANIGD